MGAWIPNIEKPNTLGYNTKWFCFEMIGCNKSYSYGPDQSKPQSLEILKKWRPFCLDFQWFWTKWLPFCYDFKWFLTKRPPLCSEWNTIGKANRGLPMEFQTGTVFQPPLYSDIIWKGSEIQPFKIQTFWKPDHSNGPVFKGSGFGYGPNHLKIRPFK